MYIKKLESTQGYPKSTEKGVYEISTFKLNGKHYWTKLDGTRFLQYNKHYKFFQVVQQVYFGVGEGTKSYVVSHSEASAVNCPHEIPKSSWKYYNGTDWEQWNESYPVISIWNGQFCKYFLNQI